MKKATLLFVLAMLVGALLLAACDTAIPNPVEEAAETEEPAGDVAPAEEGSEETVQEGTLKTIYVGPEMVECQGEGPQQCLQVKEDPNGEYMLHYFPIEGFNYEPGYEYELIISEETVDNPPPGASSLRWVLVEEVSKTPVDAVGSTESSGRIVAAFVGPQMVDCVGVAPQKCMQVKTNPDDDYSLFYDQIEGFEFEEGNEYELRVLVEPVPNPPADGSALKYTLIEVVSKTPVTVEQPAIGEPAVDMELVLEGSSWLLQSYVTLDGEVAGIVPDSRVTMALKDGQAAGSAGCNNYFGPYEVDGNALTFGLMGSTMMACTPEELMLQETAYLANLGKVASYAIVGDELQLSDGDGQVILTFVEDEAIPLVGTAWNVISYNNGKQAVVSVIIDTELNAVFTEDGIVGGSAGCNNYRASYEVDGNNITIGPAASTRKLCAEPEGIMEQESQFLTALSTAATFAIDGARMDMYAEDGARVAVFEAANVAAETGMETGMETAEMPVIAANGIEKTVYVGPELVDCVGVAPQQCLQVKEDPNAEYTLHYFPIEGFDYEPGYEYELRILETPVENPPADSSSLQWTLIEVVSKTAVDTGDTSENASESSDAAVELAGTSWQWLEMITPVENVTVDDPSKYDIEFMTDGTLAIAADCNQGSGTYEASAGSISINITATTLALCPDDSLSDLFIRSLNAAAIYFGQDGNLFIDLFADAGTMQFAPK